MKKQFIVLTSILFCTLQCLGQESIKNALSNLPVLKKDSTVSIMILGTFHFNFSENSSDFKGENNFDIHTESRQKELLTLIEKIKQFNPTKIAVEMMLSDQLVMDSLFKAYSIGAWELGRNEVYQIGFRLANELRLNGVSCVDTRPEQIEVDTTIPDLELYSKQRNELEKWEAYNEPNYQTNTYVENLRSRMTIVDYLLFLNNEMVKRRYKQFFLTGLVDVGAGDTYIGADLTGYWYRRNTRIFSNIKKLVVTGNERILVIYGNSHAWVLEELFEASPEFNIFKIDEMLK
ncbi:MAG: DUF5694 domain-containing protein [Saprospiraceae bacterium]